MASNCSREYGMTKDRWVVSNSLLHRVQHEVTCMVQRDFSGMITYACHRKITWKSREHPTVCAVVYSLPQAKPLSDERLLYAARVDDEDTIIDIFNHPGSFDINCKDGSVL